MAIIEVGQKAPDFQLRDSLGAQFRLSNAKGKNIVLYFYPKDDTPGCTKEACAFRDDMADYEDLNTVVIGISRDSSQSHANFIGKYNLNFPLLADTEGTVSEACGVWQEKNLYGKKSMGIVRTTLVIDADGIVRKVYPRVRVDGHSEAVKAFIKENLQQAG